MNGKHSHVCFLARALFHQHGKAVFNSKPFIRLSLAYFIVLHTKFSIGRKFSENSLHRLFMLYCYSISAKLTLRVGYFWFIDYTRESSVSLRIFSLTFLSSLWIAYISLLPEGAFKMGYVVNIQYSTLSLCFGCIFLLMLMHILSKFISPLEHNFSEKETLILLFVLGSFQMGVYVLMCF